MRTMHTTHPKLLAPHAVLCDKRTVRVEVVTCGPAVNESERKAIVQLKTRLISEQSEELWLLLTNLSFSANDRQQSDEIDILAIGPPGVRVIEVKHWSAARVREDPEAVGREADRVKAKAAKVGAFLRRYVEEVGWVDGVFLLTESSDRTQGLDNPVRGVPFHTFRTWREALGATRHSVLSAAQIQELGAKLTPASRLATEGRLSRIGVYGDLQLQTPPEERFHRIYKATHRSRRVILHLYDWSASDESNAEGKARREFDALHRLQQYPWAPRIVDSFQDAPGYLHEVAFFTVVDPSAPSIAERASDDSWDAQARLAFVRCAIRALDELHKSGDDDKLMLHRNLTPATVLVKHDNSPILTGLNQARIPAETTVSPATQREWDQATAPEVRAQGLAAADWRSDVYSLCASLSTLFDGASDHAAASALAQGTADDPAARSTLSELNAALARLLGEKLPAPPAPSVRFWTEEQVVTFEGHDYRIISRLGSGSIGTTFKVVEIDSETGEDLGAYVAKAVHDGETAKRVMRNYRLVRSHLRNSGLSTIYQLASNWQDNGFSALMAWIEGEPLSEYAGLLPILAEDLQEPSSDALAVRWLRTACHALGTLHGSGLVHGDVSPRNIIVCDVRRLGENVVADGVHQMRLASDVVLTDYDCVTKIGERPASPGTVNYCSPSFADGDAAAPSDDIYALAASFFHMWFDKPPFQHDDTLAKDRGLNWTGVDREPYPIFAAFLDRATAPEPTKRYETVAEALADLGTPEPASSDEPAARLGATRPSDWGFDGDDAEQENVVAAFLNALAREDKGTIASVAREFRLHGSYAETMSNTKRDLMAQLRKLDKEMLAAWIEDDCKVRDRVQREVEKYENKGTTPTPAQTRAPTPSRRLASVPLRLLQLNNVVSFGVDNDKLSRESAEALGMDEVGPYWFIDCPDHRHMNSLEEKMARDEEAGKYDIPRPYWYMFYHFQDLLSRYEGDDKTIERMDKAQKADIRFFYQEMRRWHRDPKRLELMPVVYKKNKGGRHLYLMAWEQRQEQSVKNLAPGKFRAGRVRHRDGLETTDESQSWERDDGFWLKTFLNKSEAKAWLAKTTKDRKGSLAKMGYKVSDSTARKMEEALSELKVLRKRADSTKLRTSRMEVPWDDV